MRDKFNDSNTQLTVLGLENFPAKPLSVQAPLSPSYSLARVQSGHWVQDMAICKKSWDEWPEHGHQMALYEQDIKRDLVAVDGQEFLLPRQAITAFGFKVAQVSPASYGMGPGFLAFVEASYQDVVSAVEQWMGMELLACEEDRCAGYEFSENRTLAVSLERPAGKTPPRTVIGCIYGYQP